MTWEEYLIEGELDNTVPGKVTGWMKFAGMAQNVTFDLAGDFHRDIRGAKLHFVGKDRRDDPEAERYMRRMAVFQTGKTGDITAGLPPQDFVNYPYIEWYSRENGRVVLMLEPGQVQVVGTPIPANESEPLSRAELDRNLTACLREMERRRWLRWR